MVLRVRQVGEEYFVPLTQEVVEALHLSDGAAVELQPVEDAATSPSIHFLTNDDALEIFRSTEVQHRRAYEELAK